MPRAKDEADEAWEQEERMREEALWQARKREYKPLRGKCYNCDAPCEGAYCDKDCREDYERRSKREAE